MDLATVESRLPPQELFDLQHSHHSMILMIKDMAVEHPQPWIVIVFNDEAHSLVLRHVHRVFPSPVFFRNSIFVEHLKLKSMQMKRVIHSNDIFDLPDLYSIERSVDVNPAHVHHFSVDQSLR